MFRWVEWGGRGTPAGPELDDQKSLVLALVSTGQSSPKRKHLL